MSKIYVNTLAPKSGDEIAISGSVGIRGFVSAPIGSFNSSSIDQTLSIPNNYNCLMYGPITIGSQGTFRIGLDSQVKIKDFDDV
tara:strand:- start:1649 stop:1900 length:252 start_codon:yes stop_codon:yes gene_type:complete